jgi:hypothetical protein
MYWIEVYFSNGKTLHKESENLNEVFNVYKRYVDGNSRPVVQYIKCGRDDITTSETNKFWGIVQ